MVHTAELTHRPTKELYTQFTGLHNTTYWQQERCFVNTSLSNLGITYIKAMICNSTGYGRYLFIIRVNFKRLIEQENRIAIMTEEDIPAVYKMFDSLMKQIGIPQMPPLYEWWVKRIDYCINIETPYASEYIRILQKSTVPYYQKSITQKEGSLYLPSKAKPKNRNVTINFYDKENEVESQLRNEESNATLQVLEQAQNILRLEIQCHQGKTKRIAQKYGFRQKKLYHYLNMQICFDVLDYYIYRVSKPATYQRRKVALEMVDSLEFGRKKKERIKNIITDINKQHQTINKVKERYVREGIVTRDTFNDYLCCLAKHNINAVTISDTKKLKGKTQREGLPSIYDLFINAVGPK